MQYNCCTNGKLPDMSQFQYLEIAAVYPYPNGEDGTSCEAFPGVASGLIPLEDFLSPEEDKSMLFYTVYGRDSEGYAEALHDECSLEVVKNIAGKITSQHKHLQPVVIL